MGSLSNDLKGPYVNAGTTRSIQASDHGTTFMFDQVAGSTMTLPPSTGSGKWFKFLVTVLATSNSHVLKVNNSKDFFIGIISQLSDDSPPTIKGWAAANSGTVATNSDTVTLNRSTTGSDTVGEWMEVEDIAVNTWHIRGLISGTGTEATPFSAAV
jgi:hypothetical protein